MRAVKEAKKEKKQISSVPPKRSVSHAYFLGFNRTSWNSTYRKPQRATSGRTSHLSCFAMPVPNTSHHITKGSLLGVWTQLIPTAPQPRQNGQGIMAYPNIYIFTHLQLKNKYYETGFSRRIRYDIKAHTQKSVSLS